MHLNESCIMEKFILHLRADFGVYTQHLDGNWIRHSARMGDPISGIDLCPRSTYVIGFNHIKIYPVSPHRSLARKTWTTVWHHEQVQRTGVRNQTVYINPPNLGCVCNVLCALLRRRGEMARCIKRNYANYFGYCRSIDQSVKWIIYVQRVE